MDELSFLACYVSIGREGFLNTELSYTINFSSKFYKKKNIAGIMLRNSVVLTMQFAFPYKVFLTEVSVRK